MSEDKKVAIQDGGQFYMNECGCLIADYKHLMRYECDEEGAVKARAQFLVDHPEYRMATEAECFGAEGEGA